MLPECLENFIGLRKCKVEDSTSGLYVDDLPGIDTELLPAIAPDSKGWAGLWTSAQASGYRELRQKINAQLSARMNFNELAFRTMPIDRYRNTGNTIAPSNRWRGVLAELPQSNISQIRVRNVFVFAKIAAPSNLTIFDANDGTPLYTEILTLTKGLNKIEVNEVFQTDWASMRLFIGIDCSALETIETPGGYLWEWYCNEPCVPGMDWQVRPAYIDLSLDPAIDEINIGGSAAGIWADIQIECDIDRFICQNKIRFADAFQVSYAIQLIQTKLATFRTNNMATNNNDKFQALLTFYTDRLITMLPDLLRNMDYTSQGFCFDCEGKISLTSQSMTV